MEGLWKQMFDNLFKLHGSFKMFEGLLLKEDGDGAVVSTKAGILVLHTENGVDKKYWAEQQVYLVP